MNRLIEREFAQMELIIEQRRRELQKPVEPLRIEKAVERQKTKRIERLEQDRDRAWFKGRRARLDQRIKDAYADLEKYQNRISQSANAEKRTIDTEFNKLECLAADLRKPLAVPSSLLSVEQQIVSTNDEIVAVVREYQRTAQPFSEPLKKFDLPGYIRLSGDIAAMEEKLDKNPMTEQQIAAAANAVESAAGVVKGLFGFALGTDRSRTLQVNASFMGLTLYKLVTYSHELQDRRDDLWGTYLTESATWDGLKLKSEIRKRRNELDAIPAIALPNVSLFTTTNFVLKNPFVRQRRFLEELLSVWNPPERAPAADREKISEKNQRELRIRKLRADRAAVLTDPELDDHERQMRINMYDDKIEEETEKLKDLI